MRGPIILCDVDNCISDDNWRVPHIRWHLPDPDARFHEYHSAASLDAAANIELLRMPGARLIFLTAMPARYAIHREWWLRWQRIDFERVMYRPDRDHSPSVDLKRGFIRQLRLEGVPLWECRAAYDDRPEIVDMFRDEGLPGERVAIHEQDWRELHAAAT